MENWTDTAEGHFEPLQRIEITSVLAPKKRPPNPCRFKFEKVNEATWKLTNGEVTNVPASHGQWGGYRTTRAIAWVINLAPNAWLARCGLGAFEFSFRSHTELCQGATRIFRSALSSGMTRTGR